MLHYLNYIFIQWFFIRIARVIDDDTELQTGWTIIRAIPITGYHGIPLRRW